ncbi:MAG: ATP-binding protein [Pseudomonadota bacterium]
MFPGGLADKFGNRYEALWLVNCLLMVAGDEYQSIKFEGIDPEFDGFEFFLKDETKTEWHQNKRSSPKGNWTIAALKREGIWSAFTKRLAADTMAECHFVSQDSAKELRELSEEARIAESCEQYVSKLAKLKKDEFERITDEWRVEQSIAFDRLRRIWVRTSSELDIAQMVERYGSHIIQTDQEIFPIFREFMEQRFNQEISTDEIREWLRNQSDLQFKDWQNNPTIKESILTANGRYLDTYIPFGVGGEIVDRQQKNELMEQLASPHGARLSLLTGEAGSGKSGVVRQAIEELRSLDIPVLAFRIDQLLDRRTPKDIGEVILGKSVSPVSVLKGIAPKTTSVLIIDQVDAVSEVSGRDGLVKQAIFEMLAQARQFGGVRVVVVCRTFDLENDDRFRNLQTDLRTVQIKVPKLDWETETQTVLKAKGFDTSNVLPQQRDLLCLPLNLAVFLEIGENEFGFESRTELFNRLAKHKQRKLTTDTKYVWALTKPLAMIANWMSDKQKLSAPTSLLEEYSGSEDWLSSEGIIVVRGSQLNFFHESFFDWAYAKSFVNSDRSILELLKSTEQHLFRRTQVRQILNALREDDFNRYLKELDELIFSSEVRFHIRLAIAQWLGSVSEPTQAELNVLLKLDDPKAEFSQLFRQTVLTTHHWFSLLNDTKWVEVELESDVEWRQRKLLNWLSNVAGEFPVEISALLRNWWNDRPDRAEELVGWFGFVRRNKPDDSLIKLCNDVVKSHPADLFKDDGRDRIMMLLSTWGEYNPEKSGEVLRELFDAWFVMNPDASLLDRDDIKSIDTHSLRSIAQKAPEAFILGTHQAIFKTIQQTIEAGEDGPHWWKLKIRNKSSYLAGFEELVELFGDCLAQVAKSNPILARSYLQLSDPSEHELILSFHLKAITSNPEDCGPQLIALLDNPNLLEAGYDGAKWQPFAEAAAAVSNNHPTLVGEIEKTIFALKPEQKFAAKLLARIKEAGETEYLSKKNAISWLSRSGYKEWCILHTIGSSILSSGGKQRLQELNRKFGHSTPEEAHKIEVELVQSPIKPEHTEKMSNAQWLRAINKYDNDDFRSRDNGRLVGGVRELANSLEAAAKSDPNRFIKLYWEMPEGVHRAYISGLLQGWRDAEFPDLTLLPDVVVDIHTRFAESEYHGILYLIEGHSDLTNDKRITNLLLDYAENGSAKEEQSDEVDQIEKLTANIDDLINRGSRLIIRSSNGSRCQAWDTMGRIIWHQPDLVPDIWTLLERRIATEPLVSVRCIMLGVMSRLFNEDKQRFGKNLKKLVETPPANQVSANRLSPLGTYEAVRLFPFIGFHLPSVAQQLIVELLKTEDDTLPLIGAWWAFCEAFRNGVNIDEIDSLAANGPAYRALLADVVSEAAVWTEHQELAKTKLMDAFNDEDDEVQKQAADFFGKLKDNELSDFIPLAKSFVASKAFFEHSFGFFRALEKANCYVTDIVIESAQAIFEDISKNDTQPGRRSSDIHFLEGLLKREYASSEQSPADRSNILNIVDYLLESEFYGGDSIVKANER